VNTFGQELRIAWALTPQTIAVPAGTTISDLYGSPVAAATSGIRR